MLNKWEQEEYDKKGIKKKDLIDGAYYRGHCRNSTEAVWDAETELFYYNRVKFGAKFVESITGPEDEKGFDYFLPEEKIDNPTETVDFSKLKVRIIEQSRV